MQLPDFFNTPQHAAVTRTVHSIQQIGSFDWLVNTDTPSASYDIFRNSNLSTCCTDNNINVISKIIGYTKLFNVQSNCKY